MATDFSHATDTDRAMMRRCLDLARQALGKTAPNPLVGCVIVRDRNGNPDIVGEGFHPQAGQPHAEVFALRQAQDLAHGATLYVNLEPCSHHGRTPPCADAVIAAGIRRVVVGMVDPNPQVAGRGLDRLKAAGIEVMVGVETADCQALNEGFIQRMQHQRPLGILKYAMTIDGKIATTTGHSYWITGQPARSQVHQLRAACDAIIVGGNTVRRDNPYLTNHGAGKHNPLRVVMSRSLELPTEAHLWQTDAAPTVIFTETAAHPTIKSTLESQGVEIRQLESLTPAAVTAQLYDRGCNTVLWECGGRLAAQAIADRCIQKVWAFIAPKIIGGTQAPSPVGDLQLTEMTQALALERVTCQSVGDDFLWQGYLREQS